jgi:hypothetical protein
MIHRIVWCDPEMQIVDRTDETFTDLELAQRCVDTVNHEWLRQKNGKVCFLEQEDEGEGEGT